MRYHLLMDRDEMRRRMAQHPNAVSFAEARAVLQAFGWELDRARGSHHIFKRGAERLNIPLRRPHIKPTYVRDVLAATASGGSDDDQPDDA
jgi:predicted RNA binding protein YcfA (HicA-like mRNA interferase family)